MIKAIYFATAFSASLHDVSLLPVHLIMRRERKSERERDKKIKIKYIVCVPLMSSSRSIMQNSLFSPRQRVLI